MPEEDEHRMQIVGSAGKLKVRIHHISAEKGEAAKKRLEYFAKIKAKRKAKREKRERRKKKHEKSIQEKEERTQGP